MSGSGQGCAAACMAGTIVGLVWVSMQLQQRSLFWPAARRVDQGRQARSRWWGARVIAARAWPPVPSVTVTCCSRRAENAAPAVRPHTQPALA